MICRCSTVKKRMYTWEKILESLFMEYRIYFIGIKFISRQSILYILQINFQVFLSLRIRDKCYINRFLFSRTRSHATDMIDVPKQLNDIHYRHTEITKMMLLCLS